MIPILFAEDHLMLRQSLVQIITSSHDRYRVVGECGDGETALTMIDELKPRIAIVDVSMPKRTGLDVAKEAIRRKLDVEFIVLTMYTEEEYFNAAMDLDVKGYVLKDGALTELIDALDAVAAGNMYISPRVSEYRANRARRLADQQRRSPALELLTSMERQVLVLLADNLTSKQIAMALHISYRTVQNHRVNITNKLQLRGHNRLLQFAIEHRALL